MTRHGERYPWNIQPERPRAFDVLFAAGRGGRRRERGRDDAAPPRGPGGRRFGRGGGPGGGDDPRDRLRFELMRSMTTRGHRRGRGDVRAAILLLLGEQPCNGYQLMQEIERRSDGAWRPSSGSVYPSLQQLEDEGLVEVATVPTGKLYQLTTRGTAYVTEHRAALGTPWQSEGASEASVDARRDVMTSMAQIAPALQQIARFGTTDQLAAARKVIAETRRSLYRILAETTDDADE